MTNLETITEIDIHANSDHELEELQEKMQHICHETGQEFYNIKKQSLKISNLLEQNFNEEYINTNFDEQEIIEEQIDKLIYEYKKVKEYLKNGRQVRCYIEQKEQQKTKELRYARNVLAYYGLNNQTE